MVYETYGEKIRFEKQPQVKTFLGRSQWEVTEQDEVVLSMIPRKPKLMQYLSKQRL